ncbi:hypothetical protein P7F88_09630 [Vibrio hannami]|nr:hypothetical protein [Vibrio hannami]MDG3086352.1 hypothetical protein [Vibrio hannami]
MLPLKTVFGFILPLHPLDAKVSVLRPNRSLSMSAQLIIDELQKVLGEYK